MSRSYQVRPTRPFPTEAGMEVFTLANQAMITSRFLDHQLADRHIALKAPPKGGPVSRTVSHQEEAQEPTLSSS